MATVKQQQKKAPRGRPFQKGQSGNPGGRPKMAPDMRAAMAGLVPHAVDALKSLIFSDDDSVKLKAVQIILDRNFGAASSGEGLLKEISRATIVTDEVEDFSEMLQTYKTIPDVELQEEAANAIRTSMEEIAAAGLGIAADEETDVD